MAIKEDIERAVSTLPDDLKQRMARLALAGWVFREVSHVDYYDIWQATPPTIFRRIYTSSTLLTLISSMRLVELDYGIDIGKSAPLPDAATHTGRLPPR